MHFIVQKSRFNVFKLKINYFIIKLFMFVEENEINDEKMAP
jgi:hypothetical protein